MICKNAENPCPGCRCHEKGGDAAWLFLSPAEVMAPPSPPARPAPVAVAAA